VVIRLFSNHLHPAIWRQ